MHTEDQAKQLWCPFARSLMDRGAGNRMEYGQPDDDPVNETDCMDQYRAEMANAFPCLASGCAMWRWGPEPMDTRETMLVKKGTRERVPGGYSEDVEFVLVDPDEPDPRVWRGYCGLARRGGT